MRTKLALIGLALVATGCGNAEAVVQPIAFDHALHVRTNETDCVECHRTVETSRHAGRPGTAVCGSCHDVMLGDSEAEQVVVAHVEEQREIEWKRLYRLPPGIFFSHARHVSVGQVDCQTCHGAMADQSAPPATPLVRLQMDDCIACHREQSVRDDCNACHR